MMCCALIYGVCCACPAVSDGLTIMMCQMSMNAAVWGASPTASGGLAIMMCQVSIYAAGSSACASTPGSPAGYIALLFAAVCCTCTAVLDKIALCLTLLYAAVPSAC